MFKPLDREDEWQWMVSRTHLILQGDMQGIVHYDDKGIAGCVVFDTFTPVACNVHMAVDRISCIRDGLFDEVARHGFLACGKRRFFGLVPDNNERALKLNNHIGFVEVARIPGTLTDDIGTVVMRLDRERCRFGNVMNMEMAA